MNNHSTLELNKLFQELSNLDEKRQRRIVLEICKLAVKQNEVDDPRLQDGLELLKKETYGDSPQRKAIESLILELDEIAWNIQDRVGTGTANKDEYLKAFQRARAVNAVWFGLDQDLSKAVSEAIYEANAAIDNINELKRMVEEVVEE